MSRRPPPAVILLCLLVAGISVAFLVAGPGGSDERAGDERAAAPIGDPARAGPLAQIGPRLRGLRADGTGLADAEVVARGLVDRALNALGREAREAILGALAHEDWGVQWAGALAVTRYGPADDDLLRSLADVLGEDEPWLRRAGALAASYFAATDSEVLAAALTRAAADTDAGVRGAALRTLARGAARHLERVPIFLTSLRDPDADVRGAAVYGLAQIEFQERLPPAEQDKVVEPLRGALQDTSSEVRMYAAMALGRLGARGAPAVGALLGLLDDKQSLVQSQAATALGSIGPAALPALAAAVERDRGERASLLLWALRLMGEPALLTLERTLEHPHGVVRVQAALKLWELGWDAQAILPVLTEALEAEDPDVILYAARGLGRLGPAAQAAAPRLEALVEHDSEVVRRAAAGALTLIR